MSHEMTADTGWLARAASEPLVYLTTTGRRTGRSHRIEIWFAAGEGRMYPLSGGRDRSDWVRNIRENPRVAVEMSGGDHAGIARILEEGTAEDEQARELLVAKYATPGNTLEDWKRRSLAVAIDFPPSAIEPWSTDNRDR